MASYLTSAGFIARGPEHLSLAHRSLEYLSLRAFDARIPDAEMGQYICRGHYAFLDYAFASWLDHIEAGVLESQGHLELDQLTEVLETFLDLHWVAPKRKLHPTKMLQKVMESFKTLERFDKLLQVVASMRAIGSSQTTETHLYEALDLFATLKRIRKHTEDLASQPQFHSRIFTYYGPQFYKCSRLHCKYFSEGFTTESHREEHNQKHERAYLCPQIGCHLATLGCASQRDLDKHIKDYHNLKASEDEFPDTPGGRRFQCTLCQKQYTAAHTLKNHLRTHTDERPFVCPICGKAFAKQSDRKRHDSVHDSEKMFVCKGTLQSQESWGCNRKFARADALGRHFRSLMGRICIKPLLEEISAERERASLKEQRVAQVAAVYMAPQPTMNPPLGNDFLPTALLQQYPSLGTIDWNQEPQSAVLPSQVSVMPAMEEAVELFGS